MIESFRAPFIQANPGAGLIDLRPIPSRLKYAIWAPFIRFAVRRTESVDQDGYFIYRGGAELRSILGIPNLFGGYVFLTDRQARIRWRAAGLASEEDLTSIRDAVKRIREEK